MKQTLPNKNWKELIQLLTLLKIKNFQKDQSIIIDRSQVSQILT